MSAHSLSISLLSHETEESCIAAIEAWARRRRLDRSGCPCGAKRAAFRAAKAFPNRLAAVGHRARVRSIERWSQPVDATLYLQPKSLMLVRSIPASKTNPAIY